MKGALDKFKISNPEAENDDIEKKIEDSEKMRRKELKVKFRVLLQSFIALIDDKEWDFMELMEELRLFISSFKLREGGNFEIRNYVFDGIFEGKSTDYWDLIGQIEVEDKLLRIFISKDEFSENEWPIVFSTEEKFDFGSGLYDIVEE